IDRTTSPLFERALSDDAVLTPMSRAWRAWFAARAGTAAPLAAALEDVETWRPRRGRIATSGLGDDYPIELFEELRACWAFTARSLSRSRNDDHEELACALEHTPPPPFAPTP